MINQINQVLRFHMQIIPKKKKGEKCNPTKKKNMIEIIF